MNGRIHSACGWVLPTYTVLYWGTSYILELLLAVQKYQILWVHTSFSVWIHFPSRYLIRIFLVFSYTSLELLWTLKHISRKVDSEFDSGNLFRHRCLRYNKDTINFIKFCSELVIDKGKVQCVCVLWTSHPLPIWLPPRASNLPRPKSLGSNPLVREASEYQNRWIFGKVSSL